MEVKSTGTSKVVVDLTDWRDLYAYARLVKENKPFVSRVKSMTINENNQLIVECTLGRTENDIELDKFPEHPELPGIDESNKDENEVVIKDNLMETR